MKQQSSKKSEKLIILIKNKNNNFKNIKQWSYNPYLEDVISVFSNIYSKLKWTKYGEQTFEKNFFNFKIIKSEPGFGRALYNITAMHKPKENNIIITFEDMGIQNYGFETLLDLFIEELNESNSDTYECLIERKNNSKIEKCSAEYILDSIFKRFHTSVQQLKRRHKDKGIARPTLEVKDEYDVQDYLRSMLFLFFDDVREEDPVPKTAGASSIGDFFLPKEGIMIETKFSSSKKKDKELGEEIMIDIKRYTGNDRVKKLYFFIYNPEYYIKNAEGLIKDLSKDKNIEVIVKIFPK